MSDGDRPFRVLGWSLKLAREQLSQSIDEVSGAVEIDSRDLEFIEQGKTRPSEDVLMLLISHLRLADVEASSLWEMAGYLAEQSTDQNSIQPRIFYTDLVNMNLNDSGVVMNFMQAGIDSQPQSVARVGMSKAQASHLLKILQQTLSQTNIRKARNLSPPKHLLDDGKSKDHK